MTLLIGSTGAQPTGLTVGAETENAMQATAAASGKVEQLVFKTGNTANAATTVEVGIRSDVSGVKPGVLLAKAAYVGTPGVNTEITLEVSPPLEVTAGTKYWLTVLTQGGNLHLSHNTTGEYAKSKSTTLKKLEAETSWNAATAAGPMAIWANGTAGALTRESADSLAITDATTRVLSLALRASDSLAIAELTGRGTTRATADSYSVTDAASRILSQTRTISDTTTESIGLGAVLLGGALFGGGTITAITATLTILDAIVTKGNSRNSEDTLTIMDTVVRAQTQPRTITDTLTVTDAVVLRFARIRNASDTMTISDAALRALTSTRTASDTLTLTDMATRLQGQPRTAGDSLTFTDMSARMVVLPRAAMDTITLTDATVFSHESVRGTADTITLREQVVRVVHEPMFAAGASSLLTHAEGAVAA